MNCQLPAKRLQAKGKVFSDPSLPSILLEETGHPQILTLNSALKVIIEQDIPTQHRGSREVIERSKKDFFIPFHKKNQDFMTLVPKWSRLISQRTMSSPLQENHPYSFFLSQSFYPDFFLQLFTKTSTQQGILAACHPK